MNADKIAEAILEGGMPRLDVRWRGRTAGDAVKDLAHHVGAKFVPGGYSGALGFTAVVTFPNDAAKSKFIDLAGSSRLGIEYRSNDGLVRSN